MTLQFSARLADRDVDVDLNLASGETLALLGPNGAGKSTVLGVLAGLIRPDSGRATLAEDTLFDLPTTWLAPHRRAIALLAQDALLFPHLTVRRNVEFAPRSSGATRAQAGAKADEWLERTGVRPLAERRPGGLSGGQAQRVAIARALAAEPELILLDEPLASLDVAVAGELRGMLAEVLVGRTAIVVTHDALDAYLLADRVAVLHRGRVVEEGPTREVLTHPRHPFTAELTGLSLLTGVRTAGGLVTDDGLALGGTPAVPIPAGRAVTAVVRPSAVMLRTGVGPDGGAGIAAVVTALEPRDDLVRVRTDRLTALVPAAVVAELRLTIGARVTLSVPRGDVRIAPA
ncbi:ABC transporter ATP-binding protein [Leifsonia shinshuensis]|uniref:sulfate/molybdate ABC transporter ATP-binding protein n=1 Tax=Leifsonia shinshuensis TaxID=150026 RepID=UPI001F510D70|nr:ABC transporter ATP-binding protein [Leifsonia shinshuensis]MCI0158606.1 ABC transporter ATP-binding protein [Leifsonia shinshuensis]